MLKSTKIGGIFDFGFKEKELKDLKARLTTEEVWNDHKLSAELSGQVSSLEKEMANWNKLKKDLTDLSELAELAETEEDEEMLAQTEKDLDVLKQTMNILEVEMMFSGENDTSNAFLNIHPGAGGTESNDWAEMLLRLYQRWAEKHHFSIDIVNYEPGDVAGVKDVTLFIKGRYAFGYLSAENGIHRLVRLSPFNANNKRQTSFCAVSASPEVNEKVEVNIEEKDLRVDTFRASGAGGQHVNKTSSAIRITHIPTGIVVSCQNERSQFQNRDMAMRVLKSRIYEYEKKRMAKEKAENSLDRKSIEWGNQIRSYVFQPYTLVKDHRTNLEKGNIQAVMDGEIDDFIFAYLKQFKNKG